MALVVAAVKVKPKRTVNYRTAKGYTVNALVVSAGTGSGLKLSYGYKGNIVIVDNVALATTLKQTNRYWNRRY